MPRHSSLKPSLPKKAVLVCSRRCPPAQQHLDSLPWEEVASQNCSGFCMSQKPPGPISFFAPQFYLCFSDECHVHRWLTCWFKSRLSLDTRILRFCFRNSSAIVSLPTENLATKLSFETVELSDKA